MFKPLFSMELFYCALEPCADTKYYIPNAVP